MMHRFKGRGLLNSRPRGSRRRVRSLVTRALLTAVVAFSALPAGTAFAGNLLATGHDADLHCHFGAQCHYVEVAVGFVRSGAPDPAKPVLVLDRSDQDVSIALDNAFGAGVVPRVVLDPRSPAFAVAPITTALYSAIIVASDITCGGCDLNEFGSTPDSDAINARTADIASFFNDGGGVLALSGAQHGDGAAADDTYYQFLPITVGGVAVSPPFTLTQEGRDLGFTDGTGGTPNDINCCATHNSFQEPPAGSALKVAERDSRGFAETLFASGRIIGGRIFTLTLEPESATNPRGTTHTVTATLTDQNGPVANRTIRFSVTGANTASGAGVTNAQGKASFTYTGSVSGSDTITACFDADGANGCEPDEPADTATKEWTGVPPPAGLDHFLYYPIEDGTPTFRERTVTVRDQFRTSRVLVEEPLRLLNPASKNGGTIIRPNAHLKCYEIEESRFGGRTVTVQNQFGTRTFQVRQPTRLCNPASKRVPPGTPPAVPSGLGHFRCYGIEAGPVNRTVTLRDQFGRQQVVVGEPEYLCNPASKNGSGIQNPTRHLVCYELEGVDPFRERRASLRDQFGVQTFTVDDPTKLCVPSSKRV
jgi:hypothetical protein